MTASTRCTKVSLPNLPNAACKGRDTDVWFQDSTVAQAICRTCPEQQPCLEYAWPDSTLSGVWGGTTATQRQSIRTAHRATDGRCRRCLCSHRGGRPYRDGLCPTCRADVEEQP